MGCCKCLWCMYDRVHLCTWFEMRCVICLWVSFVCEFMMNSFQKTKRKKTITLTRKCTNQHREKREKNGLKTEWCALHLNKNTTIHILRLSSRPFTKSSKLDWNYFSCVTKHLLNCFVLYSITNNIFFLLF